MKKVAVAAAVAVALSVAVPALGSNAVQSSNPLRVAKHALKIGKSARTTARSANAKANRALDRLDSTADALGGIQTVQATKSVPGGLIDSLDVSCPAGTTVVSGGWTVISGSGYAFWDHQSGNGWSIGIDNFDGFTSADSTVFANCAGTQGVVTAKAPTRTNRAAAIKAQIQSHEG